LFVEWLCTRERLNPEVVNIFGAAARCRRASVGRSHDGMHPDNSTLHTGKNLLFSAVHQQSCSPPAATATRRRGSELGTTIKYLRKQRAAPRASASAPRLRTRDAQRAPPQTAAWAPRPTTRAAPQATAGLNDQVPSTQNKRRRGQWPGHRGK
jgi:hypothetical protein